MSRLVGRTVPGAPAVGRQMAPVPRHHPPPTARPTPADGRRFISRTNLPTPRRGGLPRPARRGLTGNVGAPRTHVAPTPQSRRRAPRQLPFQGSRGVGRRFMAMAHLFTHDADTYVYLTPVRGGVLDAPRSDYYRGGFVAPPFGVADFTPRFPRCTRICLPPSVCDFAGTARAPIFYGRPTFSVDPRPGGRGSPPLR